MSEHIDIKDIDVVLLCGGLGKRLRPLVKDLPKPMAKINNRPFLDLLIDYAASFGFRRFIFCIGHLGNIVRQYYQSRKPPFETIFSEEKIPLGTAGALKNAAPLIRSAPFLVMNGDSFCKVDLRKFLSFHLQKKALLSVVLANMEYAKNYGSVMLTDKQRVSGFKEKSDNGKNNLVSCGIYFFEPQIFSLIPKSKEVSLEKDLFPRLINKEFYGYLTDKKFIDIGTPARYKEAVRLLSAKV